MMLVHIKTKTGQQVKEIGISTFRAKCISPPISKLLGKSSGYISTRTIHAAAGPTAQYDGFEFDSRVIIKKMTVIVIRNNREVYNNIVRNESGVRFSDDDATRKMIMSLQPGDSLKLEDMTYSCPPHLNPAHTDCGNNLAPIMVTITD